MNNTNQNKDDLNSVLRIKGLNIKKYENIINQLKLSNKNGKIKIRFPHKYLYELYKVELKNIVEQYFEEKITYIINNQLKLENKTRINHHLNTNKYNFENYIPGTKNKVLLNICKEINTTDKIRYNPLIIYGESSSGKTHLVNSIINASKKNNKFIKDLFNINQTLLSNNIMEIHDDIVKNEIAVIENIHHIDNKASNILLEKLIDHFYENNKQLILTYNGKKIKLSDFPESLSVRINSGLSIKIKNPDLNVKINYAKRFCKENKIYISCENIFTISSNCNNIRSIKGMLLKLTTLPEINGPVNSKQINKILDEKLEKKNISFKNILEVISKTTGFAAEELLSMNRGKKLSRARQICMYICKSKLNWSYPKIGMKFGGRDHSTVIYNVKKVKQIKDVDQEMNSMLSELLQNVDNIPKNNT
jgi:chromosomal replication initiator protein